MTMTTPETFRGHPAELTTSLLKYHTRRIARVENAWHSAADYLGAWVLLSYLRPHDMDADEFRELISADVAVHGVPSTLDAFVHHFNRLMEARATLFDNLYILGPLLGQGGFSTVLRGQRKGMGDVVLKCSKKNFSASRNLELLESETEIWSNDALVHPGLVRGDARR